MSFTAFGLVSAGVMKAFQISNDLGETKEILRDIRRSLEDHSPRANQQKIAQGQETVFREYDENSYAAAVLAKASQESALPLMSAVNAESELPTLDGEVLRAPLQR